LATVHSLGVLFIVWKSKDSKKTEWTSLLRNEKRILPQKLPTFFITFLPPARARAVEKLWNVS